MTAQPLKLLTCCLCGKVKVGYGVVRKGKYYHKKCFEDYTIEVANGRQPKL